MRDNCSGERPSFVTHLECAATGEHHEADQPQGLSRAGKPLFVRYDLPALARALPRSALAERSPDMWRYRELLPVRQAANIVSLGEMTTPLISAAESARASGGRGDLLVKDEGRLPTGSFKARGLCVAVSKAKEFGVSRIAMPTAGNAGAALAAYCSRAGIESIVFCPDDAPETTISEIRSARSSRTARRRAAGSVSRRSRSPIGSRARRPWGWSWPSSSVGKCRTSSSTRRAAAPA